MVFLRSLLWGIAIAICLYAGPFFLLEFLHPATSPQSEAIASFIFLLGWIFAIFFFSMMQVHTAKKDSVLLESVMTIIISFLFYQITFTQSASYFLNSVDPEFSQEIQSTGEALMWNSLIIMYVTIPLYVISLFIAYLIIHRKSKNKNK